MGYNDMDALWTHKNGSVIYVGNKNAAKNIHVLRSRRIYSIVNCTHGPAKIPNFHASLDGFNYFEFQVNYVPIPLLIQYLLLMQNSFISYYIILILFLKIAEWMLHVGEAEGPQSILSMISYTISFLNSNLFFFCVDFVNPLFAFIDAAIHSNQSILIHCLVGAHRAGTTACLCLMNYESTRRMNLLLFYPNRYKQGHNLNITLAVDLSAMSAIQKAKSIRPIIGRICIQYSAYYHPVIYEAIAYLNCKFMCYRSDSAFARVAEEVRGGKDRQHFFFFFLFECVCSQLTRVSLNGFLMLENWMPR